MAVTLINGHVLLPFAANWKNDLQWQRAWQTQVSPAVTGAESRTAVRMNPRVTLKWTVSPADLQEEARLDDALRAAVKSGLACAPVWGRGSALSSALNAASAIAITSSTWPWAIGDTVFFMDPFRVWETGTLNGVSGLNLTLAVAVAGAYPSGAFIWPLMFGELTAPSLEAVTSWHGETSLSLRERISPASAAVVGTYTAPLSDPGYGIGDMTIETDFYVR